jgi:hypothetical protein
MTCRAVTGSPVLSTRIYIPIGWQVLPRAFEAALKNKIYSHAVLRHVRRSKRKVVTRGWGVRSEGATSPGQVRPVPQANVVLDGFYLQYVVSSLITYLLTYFDP